MKNTNAFLRTGKIAIRPDRFIWRGNAVRGSILSLAVAGFLGIAEPAHAGHSWKSGASGHDSHVFAAWRGAPLDLATGWFPWKSGGWSAMTSYASGKNPRTLRSRSANVSLGMPMFPAGGNLADCAAGKYAAQHADIGRRLTANGVGDAELRVGWEANNTSYPWTAVNRSATQWRACFASVAAALKSGAPNARITWHMAKKGKINVNAIWPAEVAHLISNVGVSHYDDPYARFGTETSGGSPWGLRAWLAFARAKGKKLSMAEWGVGRRGDNPAYIREMFAFFKEAGGDLAHEGYFRGSGYNLYPSAGLPASAAEYRRLW